VSITYAIKNKSFSDLSFLLDNFESSNRVASNWKKLTNSDEFLVAMKAMFALQDGGSSFFRCVILFIKFLAGAASKNDSERNELLSIKSSIEGQMEKFLEADYFDEVSNVLDLLFHGTPKAKHIFVPEMSIIGYCLENDVKIIFNNSTVVSTLTSVFYHCPSFISSVFGFDFKCPVYACYSPIIMFILEVLAKCLMVLVTGVVSINGARNGSDYSSVARHWSDAEVLLAVLLFSVILHTIGEVWDSGWRVKRYFLDSWNLLGASSSLLGIIWFFFRFNSSHFTISRMALALQAITEAF